MADNFENETNDLIDNAAADLINASAKEQADEIRAEAQGSMDAENSAIQQNTALLQQNAQAQKSLNEEKQKTLTIQQAIDNAVAESMRQRNEMMVYHGSGANFNKFDSQYMSSGAGGQSFLEGHYFTSNKKVATDYSSSASNHVGDDIESFKFNRDKELIESWRDAERYSKEDGISIDQFVENLEKLKQEALNKVKELGEDAVDEYFSSYKDNANALQREIDNIKKYQSGEHNYTPQELQQFAQNNRRENFLYYSAIPKDTGKNYFDYESIDFNDLKSRTSDDKVLSIISELEEKTYGVIGEHFITALQSANMNPLDVLKDMGFIGNKWSTSRVEGGNPNDVNYTVYDDSNTRILKREVTNYEQLESQLRENGIDTSLYNPITYVDESLKSAIENSNFDGARFIFDIAEAIKSKIIPSNGTQIASGSFVIGPNLENFTAQKVNDLVLTKDGRAYITDDADSIIATKNLGGMTAVKNEGSNKVVGILSNSDAKILMDLTDSMHKFAERNGKNYQEKERWQEMNASRNAILNNAANKYNEVWTTADVYAQYEAEVLKNLPKNRRQQLEREVRNWNGKTDTAERIYAQTNRLRGEAGLRDWQSFTTDSNKEKLDNGLKNFLHLNKEFERFSSFFDSLRKSDFKTFADEANLKAFDKRASRLGHLSYQTQEADEEGNIVTKTIKGTGLLGTLETYRDRLNEIKKIIDDESLSEEQRKEYLVDAKEVTDGYKQALEDVNKEMENLSKETKENNPALRDRATYDEYKYALWRDKNQQEDFKANMPQAFGTTGNLRESFLKTVFNKSVGFRQQQGLVGFAANLGYNKSGTALSIGLGALASAVKKAGQAILQFSKESVEAYGELQSIKTNLGIVYGSQTEADQTFNEIAQYSIKSPFGVQTVSEYAVLLKQSGIYASDLMDTLKQIGDVAGGNQQKFANIANAFSQIEANGKATTRQLRQFATAGIPIYKELIKAYAEVKGDNVGVEQIRKLTEEGKITAGVIEKAFSNMTGPGGTFENAVNIGAKTWKARQQNLADAKQLAQAAFGELEIGLGGTGRGDSIAESILSLKESFYQTINDWASIRNIEKSVKNIEEQDRIVEELKKQRELLKESGASKDILDAMDRKINEAASYISPEKQRATDLTAYQMAMSKITDKEIISDSEYNKLRRISQEIFNPETTGKTETEFNAEKFAAGYKLSNSVTQRQYNKASKDVEKFRENAMIALSDSFFGSGYESLDKSINKNDKSLYLLKQKSDAAMKQTPQGQKAEEEKKRKEWNDQKAVYDQYSKLIDDNGNLLSTFKGTIKEAVTIINSGVITPLEEIKFKPEELASDYIYNLAEDKNRRAEQLKQRRDDFKYIQSSLDSTIETLMGTSDISTFAKNELQAFKNKNLTKDENGNYKENTESEIKILSDALIALVNKLNANGNEDISTMLSLSTTRREKTGQIASYDEANKKTDIYPLWQRILNQTIGTDLEHFKNGAFTNGRQAMMAYDQQAQRDIIKTTMRSMMTGNTLKDVLTGANGYSRLVYKAESLSTPNNSRDNSKTIDWNATYNSIAKFATSLDAASSVTQAFSSSLDSEVETLKDFLSESFTITESAANIYDPAYKNFIGKYANQFEASNINAYDLFFEETADGTLKLKENATAAAEELLKQKDELSKTVSVLSSFKETIESTRIQIQQLNDERAIYSGAYDKTGLSPEQLKKVFSGVDAFRGDPLYANLDVGGILSSVLSGNEKTADVIEKNKKERTKADEQLRKTYEAELEKYNKENERYQTELETAREAEKNAKDNYEKLNTEYNDIISQTPGPHTAKAITEKHKESETAKKEWDSAVEATGKLKAPRAPSYTESAFTNDDARDELILAIYNLIQAIKDEQYSERRTEFAKGLNTLYAHQNDEGLSQFEMSAGTDWLRTAGSGFNVYKGNNFNEQKALNFMGIRQGAVMSDEVRKSFFNEDNSVNQDELTKLYQGLGIKEGDNTPDLTGTWEENVKALSQFITKQARAQEQAITLNQTFADLGTNIKDTFSKSVADGFMDSMKYLGKNIEDWSDATEDLTKQWRNVTAQMLEAIGPAATQAGLTLIADKKYGQGFALVAAGGVLNFLGGMLEDDSKKDDEEKRLQNLRSLLIDIIEQAKKDAEYYERNSVHQKALSEANTISVNDAIIAPNGNVISTSPEDYLIATKTPGNYANLGGKGSTVVNFSIIDQSTGVQVKDIQKKENADGSIDLTAIIVSSVSQAVADGTLDDAFDAREVRVNGKSYAY